MVLDHRAGQQKNACKAAFYAAQRFKSRSFFKCCFCHYMFDMFDITTMVYVPIRTTGRLQFHTPAAGNTHPPKYPDEVTERARITPSFFWVVLVGCVPPGHHCRDRPVSRVARYAGYGHPKASWGRRTQCTYLFGVVRTRTW